MKAQGDILIVARLTDGIRGDPQRQISTRGGTLSNPVPLGKRHSNSASGRQPEVTTEELPYCRGCPRVPSISKLFPCPSQASVEKMTLCKGKNLLRTV